MVGINITDEYKKLLYPTESDAVMTIKERTDHIRRLILEHGISAESEKQQNDQQDIHLRGDIWKLLMGLKSVSAQEYIKLIKKGPSPVFEKIKNDTHRTFKNDSKFWSKVDEGMLVRVLNAFAWKAQDISVNGCTFSYVQGMNALAGMFLYVMPELDAFYAFTQFITRVCPTYVQPLLEGAHAGVQVLGQCMAFLDKELNDHLNKDLMPVMYALPPVLSLSTSTPPLDEAVSLWDYFMAFGFESNINCVIAQFQLMRDQIMQSRSVMQIVRTLPNLNAQKIISLAVQNDKKLSSDLREKLKRHLVDIEFSHKHSNEKKPSSLSVQAKLDLEEDDDFDLNEL